MSTNIEAVRTQLLDTLKDLRNRDQPMEPDRARAIAQVAGVIVDSARVEVDYIKAVGANNGTGFIAIPDETPPLGSGGVTVRTHRLK